MRERREEEYSDTQWVTETQQGSPTVLEHQSQCHLHIPTLCLDCNRNM